MAPAPARSRSRCPLQWGVLATRPPISFLPAYELFTTCSSIRRPACHDPCRIGDHASLHDRCLCLCGEFGRQSKRRTWSCNGAGCSARHPWRCSIACCECHPGIAGHFVRRIPILPHPTCLFRTSTGLKRYFRLLLLWRVALDLRTIGRDLQPSMEVASRCGCPLPVERRTECSSLATIR